MCYHADFGRSRSNGIRALTTSAWKRPLASRLSISRKVDQNRHGSLVHIYSSLVTKYGRQLNRKKIQKNYSNRVDTRAHACQTQKWRQTLGNKTSVINKLLLRVITMIIQPNEFLVFDGCDGVSVPFRSWMAGLHILKYPNYFKVLQLAIG